MAVSDEEQAVSTAMLGALQIQEEGDPVRSDAQRAARIGMHAHLRRRRVTLQVPVLVQENTHVHADGLAFQPRRRNPRVFEPFPGQFEEDSLLGIDVPGFPRRDVEESGVEPVDIVYETTVGGIVLAVRPRVPQRFPFRGNGTYGVAAVQDEFPESTGAT